MESITPGAQTEFHFLLTIMLELVKLCRFIKLVALASSLTLILVGAADDSRWNQWSLDPVEDIKDAIVSFRSHLISKVSSTLSEISEIQTLGQIVDATIEEDCETLTCPDGLTKTQNSSYFPNTDGCGAFGYMWKKENLPHEDLEGCCNAHDFCYDECGADKDVCDLHFKKCLYKVCKSQQGLWSDLQMKGCKGTAKLMHTGTLALGCKAYQDAQKNACICQQHPPKREL